MTGGISNAGNTPVTSTPDTTASIVVTTSPVNPTVTLPATATFGWYDPNDVRVSWVYQLKRDELVIELNKFGLDVTGTVDILKKRLVTFIRLGKATPAPTTMTGFTFPTQPNPPATSSTTNSTTALTPTSNTRTSISGTTQTIQTPVPTITIQPPITYGSPVIPLKVHKWNLNFNGRNDPVTFIERLQEICVSQGVDMNNLLPQMPELFQGEAALWFRNNRQNWHTWAEFITDFRFFYFPLNYAEDLEAEISRRLQRPNEPTCRYITDLQTLVRRHGGIGTSQELQWLYRNLLPEYRQQVRKTDFTDISSFSRVVRETELLLEQLRQSRITNRYPTQARQNEPTSGISRPPQPLPGRRNHAPQSFQNPQRPEKLCWRCGKTGHFRTECRGTPTLFCSRCRKTGVMSRDCPCSRPSTEN